MLQTLTVLDFTDERGELGPMILADLGATVIRIEQPGGSRARRTPPRPDGHVDGLTYAAFNRGKQSIVLDPESASDQRKLEALLCAADLLFEPFPDGGLAYFGYDYAAVSTLNPQLVFVAMSAFGRTGPYADFVGNDLTIAAMGGPMSMQGVAARAPVRVSLPQVWRHTGAEAASAALIGLAYRRTSGRGRFVDVSAQSVMTWTMLNGMSAQAIQGHDFQRAGSDIQTGRMRVRCVYPTQDGYVLGIPRGNMIEAFLDRMIEAGVADAELRSMDWDAYTLNVDNPDFEPFNLRDGEALCERFFSTQKKQDLFEYGLARGVSLVPVNTLTDLLALPHLAERDFWALERDVRFPGLWFQQTGHSRDVRTSAPELDADAQKTVVASNADKVSLGTDLNHSTTDQQETLPFADIRVADFSWVGVGPISTKVLADHGADVIRVESQTRPDVLRAAGPYTGDTPGLNKSQFYGNFNTSKRSLSLDLKQPEAIDIARRLIAQSDVLVESFAPGALQRMGLTYESLAAENPSLIMVSTCLMGQSGPLAQLAGFGYHAAALAGFYEVTGWPDLPPDGPWMAYTDTIAPRFISSLLMAALDQRRRTGRGAYFDVAQIETALQFLAPELLHVQTGGEQATRMGNRSHFAAPQGCYPCKGEDRWCAIGIDTDEQWQALCAELERGDLATLDQAERVHRHDELDQIMAAWTADQDAYALMQRLQDLRVPAGVVQSSGDLLHDPQYAHRDFYRWIDHQEMGHIPYAGHQYSLSDIDHGPRSPAPCLGEHSYEILSALLGLDDEAIAHAFASGIVN